MWTGVQVFGAQADQGIYSGMKYIQEWNWGEHAKKKIGQIRSGTGISWCLPMLMSTEQTGVARWEG